MFSYGGEGLRFDEAIHKNLILWIYRHNLKFSQIVDYNPISKC